MGLLKFVRLVCFISFNVSDSGQKGWLLMMVMEHSFHTRLVCTGKMAELSWYGVSLKAAAASICLFDMSQK